MSARDLAERLVGVRRVHLVAGAVAEPRRALGRLAERPVERGGELRRVRQDPDVARTRRASSASRIAATWPSIMPLGPTRCAPGLGLRDRDPPVALERRVVVDVAARRRARRSGRGRCTRPGTGRRSRRGRRRARSRSTRERLLRDPVRVPRLGPLGVLAFGDAEQHERADARAPRSRPPPCAAISSVCWDCPGIEAIGTASDTPSLTNSGATRCRGASSVSRISARSAGVRRIRRGRCRRGSLIAGMLPRREHPLDGGDQAVDRVRVRDGVHAQAVLRAPRAPSRGRCTRPSGCPSPRPSRARTRAPWRRS